MIPAAYPWIAAQNGSCTPNGSRGPDSVAPKTSVLAVSTLVPGQSPTTSEFGYTGRIATAAQLVDCNASARAATAAAAAGVGLGGKLTAVGALACNSIVSGLQLIQGPMLIWLGCELCEKSSKELETATNNKIQDQKGYDIAKLTHANHISLAILGVLFTLVGALGAVGIVGVSLSFSALALGAIALAGTVLGGILSVVCIARGGLLVYRAISSLKEVNEFQSQLFDKIKEEPPEAVLSWINTKKASCLKRWLKPETINALKASASLSTLEKQTALLLLEKQTALLLNVCRDIHEKKVQDKTLLAIGALMVLGGIAGTVAAGFAGASGVGSVAAGGIVTAALATTVAANGIFATMEALWLPVDSGDVFKWVKKQVDKVDCGIPLDVRMCLEPDQVFKELEEKEGRIFALKALLKREIKCDLPTNRLEGFKNEELVRDIGRSIEENEGPQLYLKENGKLKKIKKITELKTFIEAHNFAGALMSLNMPQAVWMLFLYEYIFKSDLDYNKYLALGNQPIVPSSGPVAILAEIIGDQVVVTYEQNMAFLDYRADDDIHPVDFGHFQIKAVYDKSSTDKRVAITFKPVTEYLEDELKSALPRE